jgi:protein SCO1/2
VIKRDLLHGEKIYLAVKMGKPEELYDMVHTENLVLVDTKESSSFMTALKEDIVRLIEDINFFK